MQLIPSYYLNLNEILLSLIIFHKNKKNNRYIYIKKHISQNVQIFKIVYVCIDFYFPSKVN